MEEYNAGNQLFYSRKYDDAIREYNRALLKQPELINKELKLKILLNLSQCNLLLRDYDVRFAP